MGPLTYRLSDRSFELRETSKRKQRRMPKMYGK